MAPRKVRLVAQAIRGLRVSEAEAKLMLLPQRARLPILKLLRSAIANAKTTKSLPAEKLIVSEIRVDQGPMLKRFLPRAMGRATPVHKKMSHITIVLGEASEAAPSRFRISLAKRQSKKMERRADRDKPESRRDESRAKEPGFMKRMFRRKSV